MADRVGVYAPTLRARNLRLRTMPPTAAFPRCITLGYTAVSGPSSSALLRSVPTLYLLTGPWGSGKTSVVPHLARLLPEAVVFDWDVLLPGLSAAAGTDAHRDETTWDGLAEMWVAVVEAVLAGGHDVVLCGPARPDDVATAGFGGASLRCAFLNAPDDALAARLRSRGETEEEITEELSDAAALRASSWVPISTAGRSPAEVAEEVALWVSAPAV